MASEFVGSILTEDMWSALRAGLEVSAMIAHAERDQVIPMIEAERRCHGSNSERTVIVIAQCVLEITTAQAVIAQAAVALLQECAKAVDERALAALDVSGRPQ